MKLHRGQQDALDVFLAGLHIDADSSVSYTDYQSIGPLLNQILKAPPWKDVLGESEFWSLVWRIVFANINEVPRAYRGPLSAADNDGAFVRKIRDTLIDEFELLPAIYDVYIPMPSIIPLMQAEVELTREIALVDGNENTKLKEFVREGIPLNALLGFSDANSLQVPSLNVRYLRVQKRGYGDGDPDSPVTRSAVATAKQFIFVGLASGAFELTPSYGFWSDGSTSLRTPVLVIRHERTDMGMFRVNPGFDIAKLFDRIRLVEPLTVLDLSEGHTFLDAPQRPAVSDEDIRTAIGSRLHIAVAFMSLNSVDATPSRAAMEWCVDALATQNESVAFLQRCIGLEALLGGGDTRRDVTERLSDRFAYLMGKTDSERERLRKNFRDMYGNRSEVVHGRANRLSEKHRRASTEAGQMLYNATWAEMNNLIRALPS